MITSGRFFLLGSEILSAGDASRAVVAGLNRSDRWQLLLSDTKIEIEYRFVYFVF